MKQIYEIPEVTIFEVGTCKQMIAESPTQTFGSYGLGASQGGGQLGNDNSLDDQSTPWYRR